MRSSDFSLSYSSLALLSVLGVIGFAPAKGQGEVPPLVAYQLRVTDAFGDPLDGSFAVYFSIYGNADTVTPLWQEAYESPKLEIRDGLISVLLGSRNPLPVDLFQADMLYLGVRVEGDTELLPRKRIVSVPYAFRAEMLGEKRPEDFLLAEELEEHMEDPQAHPGITVSAAQIEGVLPEEKIPAAIARTTSVESHVQDRNNPHHVNLNQITGETRHGDLQDVGVYSHEEIDEHIDSQGNPHGVRADLLECPGDMADAGAYCIEKEERSAASWFSAAEACRASGRRLCRPGEWYAACADAEDLGLSGMTGNHEWVDNWLSVSVSTDNRVRVLTMGRSGCSDTSVDSKPTDSVHFRCCQ